MWLAVRPWKRLRERARLVVALPVALAGSLLLLASCLPITPALDSEIPMPPTVDDGYESRRAPLFGFVIESHADGESHRLVATDPERTVLHAGSLEDCEIRLVEALEEVHGTGNLNVPVKTSGGAQFWDDLAVHGGWTVQQHVYTGHCRLLDPKNVRRAWGSFEQCCTALEKRRVAEKIEWPTRHLVVLLHGLGRSKHSFVKMHDHLETEGYAVVSINYASTRRSLEEHAEHLGGLLGRLDGIDKVSFVTHSLGGIVVRKLLAEERAWERRIELGRIVMLAPPNQGSVAAEYLQEWGLFQVLAGEAGTQVTPEGLKDLPAPRCEFGIIAGGNGEENGMNPLLPGDDDMVVTVENTKLEGSADWMLVNRGHTFIMSAEEVLEAVEGFLGEGCFPR